MTQPSLLTAIISSLRLMLERAICCILRENEMLVKFMPNDPKLEEDITFTKISRTKSQDQTDEVRNQGLNKAGG